MSKYPDVLFHPHHAHLLEFFFLFSIKVLDGNEPLPKGAAAEFWVSKPIATIPTLPSIPPFSKAPSFATKSAYYDTAMRGECSRAQHAFPRPSPSRFPITRNQWRSVP